MNIAPQSYTIDLYILHLNLFRNFKADFISLISISKILLQIEKI